LVLALHICPLAELSFRGYPHLLALLLRVCHWISSWTQETVQHCLGARKHSFWQLMLEVS